LKSNLDISDSVAGLKLEKSGGKHGGGECGEAVVEFFLPRRDEVWMFYYRRKKIGK